MGSGPIRVLGVSPDPRALRAALAPLLGARTVVASFSDSRLRLARRLIADESVDFLAFHALVGRVMMSLGMESYQVASPALQENAIALACADLDEESPFAACARFAGLHRRLHALIADLRHAGYDAARLRTEARKAQGPLALKLDSLAEVWSGMTDRVLASGKELGSERVSRCISSAPDGILPLAKVVLLVGDEAPPSYLEWVGWLAGRGIDFDVLVDWLPGAPDVFKSAREVAGRLGVEVVAVGAPSWTEGLFKDGSALEDPPVAVSIESCADPLAECEWVLRQCLELLADGLLPNKIGLYVRNSEAYMPLLDTTARRLGVPLQLEWQAPLLTNSFAEALLRLLECLTSRDVRDVARALCTSYIGLSRQGQEGLLSAAKEAHRAGETSPEALIPWARAETEELAEERKRALIVLEWYAEVRGESFTPGQWLARLRKLVGECGMAESATAEGSSVQERDARAQTALQRPLGAYAEACGPEVTYGLDGFVRLCGELWENERTVVPSPVEGIVASSSVDALGDLDVLFVLEMLEGTLPRRRVQCPILHDGDRRAMGELFPEQAPLQDSLDKAWMERGLFTRLCALPAKRLVLTYPQTEEERDNIAAFWLHDVDRLLGGRARKVDHERTMLAPSVERCRNEADAALREALDGDRDDPDVATLRSEAVRDLVRLKPEDPRPIGEYAYAALCPFWAVWRHRVSIFPESTGVSVFQLGKLAQKARLLCSTDPESARTAIGTVIDAEIDRLQGEHPGWEIDLFEWAARRAAEAYVDREFAARQTWQPDMSEAQFDTTARGAGFTCKITGPDRKSYWFDVPIDASYRVAGRRTIHLTKARKSIGFSKLDNAPPESFVEVAMLLLGALHCESTPGAVVIESRSKRMLIASPGARAQIHADMGAGLDVRSAEIEDVRGPFSQYWRGVIVGLTRGDMRPLSGNHCDRCQFGEVCRAHWHFAEADAALRFGTEEEEARDE